MTSDHDPPPRRQRQATGTHRVQAYHRLGQALAARPELTAAAPAIVDVLLELTEAGGASVAVVAGSELVYVAAVGLAASYQGRRSPLVGSFSGGVASRGAAALFRPEGAAVGSLMRATANRIGCGVVAPILVGGRAVGTLGIVHADPEALGESHVALLADLGHFVGASLG